MESDLVFQGTLEDLTRTLAELPGTGEYRMTLSPATQVESADTLDRAIERLRSRSAAEKEALRERVLASIPRPTPLPPGKTLEDVISGKWPGDEPDEVVFAALEKLS